MKTAIPDPALQKALIEYRTLLKTFQSVQLATVSADGTPEASTSPAILDENKQFFIFVSEMSAHTSHMLANKKASVMIVADESASPQIFARKRATFTCQVIEIARGSERGMAITELFFKKFGNVMESITAMGDFHLIQLLPLKGRVVLGFGRAFDVTGDQLDRLEHVKGIADQGHRPMTQSHEDAAPAPAERIQAADAERIISHMNEDHLDSVLLYVRHFAKRDDVYSARLSSIDAQGMGITVNSGETLVIPFQKPLRNAHDAHMTLVSMSKEAKSKLATAEV